MNESKEEAYFIGGDPAWNEKSVGTFFPRDAEGSIGNLTPPTYATWRRE